MSINILPEVLLFACCRKRCKIKIYLQWKTNGKSYMAYQMAATAVTLNDLERPSGYHYALFHMAAFQANCVKLTESISISSKSVAQ